MTRATTARQPFYKHCCHRAAVPLLTLHSIFQNPGKAASLAASPLVAALMTTLKILKCATNRDRLLLTTLCYMNTIHSLKVVSIFWCIPLWMTLHLFYPNFFICSTYVLGLTQWNLTSFEFKFEKFRKTETANRAETEQRQDATKKILISYYEESLESSNLNSTSLHPNKGTT